MGEGNTSKCNITCVGKFPNFAHLMEWGKIIGNIKNIIILSLSLSLTRSEYFDYKETLLFESFMLRFDV